MLSTDYVLGIDPGSKGALCLLAQSGEPIFYDMPVTYTEWRLLYHRLLGHAPGIYEAACEDVHSLFGMSAKSNFNFGGMVRTVQTVVGMAIGGYVRYIQITPKQWQKEVGLSFPKRTKPAERKKLATAHATALIGEEMAQKYFYGPRGGLLDGRVDAYLIAYALLRRSQNATETSTPA